MNKMLNFRKLRSLIKDLIKFVSGSSYMPNLKSKSEFNIEAAKQLIGSGLYAPSVHCSYYGSFQFIHSKLVKLLQITYVELDSRISASDSGSHEYIIREFKPFVEKKADYLVASDFNRKIKDLKAFRKASDYQDVSIDVTKSNDAYNISLEIIKTIKKYL